MEEPTTTTRKIILRRRPGRLLCDRDTHIETVALPQLADGEALVRTELIAMDPVTRVIINEDIGLVPPIPLGAALRSFGAGVVVRSRNRLLPVGARVTGFFEWSDWQITTDEPRTQVLADDTSLTAGLNVYGHTAMAAYFGMLTVGDATAGEIVLVSGASGAVGSVAGQLARIHGARVIGLTGGESKRRWLVDELRFDTAIDYTVPGWAERLAADHPGGIDLFFDNVGGEMLRTALPLIAMPGRIVSCGASAQYTSTTPLAAPENPTQVPILRFNAMDYLPRFGEAAEQMLGWQRDGLLQFPQMTVDGLEHAPDALNMLFDGRSRGRVLVKLV